MPFTFDVNMIAQAQFREFAGHSNILIPEFALKFIVGLNLEYTPSIFWIYIQNPNDHSRKIRFTCHFVHHLSPPNPKLESIPRATTIPPTFLANLMRRSYFSSSVQTGVTLFMFSGRCLK